MKKLAEQSKEMGGPQNKGEIEWDWVIKQWGNSRTRHVWCSRDLDVRTDNVPQTSNFTESDVPWAQGEYNPWD